MKISEKWISDGGKLHQIQTHNWNPILKSVAVHRDAGAPTPIEGEHVARLPAALVAQWAREAGVQWHDKEAMQEVIRIKLATGDYDRFKVARQ
jgi:hypothetical protein